MLDMTMYFKVKVGTTDSTLGNEAILVLMAADNLSSSKISARTNSQQSVTRGLRKTFKTYASPETLKSSLIII